MVWQTINSWLLKIVVGTVKTLVKFEGYDGVESVQHIRNAYLCLPPEMDS